MVRVRLAEYEDSEAPRCPDHGFPMVLEDFDPTYRQGLFLCPVEDCRREYHAGPSDHEILYRENLR